MCAIRSNCTNDADPNSCVAPYADIHPAFPKYYSDALICSDLGLNNEPICCSEAQNNQLKDNFAIIDNSFGSASLNSVGGCDICGANLKRFWCHFTCSPNQSDFVQAFDHYWAPSDLHPGEFLYVLNLTLTADPALVCGIFQSCNKTQYVTQVAAMQTAIGFLKFQGAKAVSTGFTFINMVFDTMNKSLNFPADQCNASYQNYVTPSGYPVGKNCSCNNCENSCAGLNIAKFINMPTTLQGFNHTLVAVFFASILAELILVTLFRKYKANKKESAKKQIQAQQDELSRDTKNQ